MVDLPAWEMPKIISIGNLACFPNIKKNGVSCIVELKGVLWASCMNDRIQANCSVQYCYTSKAWHVGRVECIRSDTELPYGR